MPPIRRDSFYAIRFWRAVDKSGDCWLWTKSRNRHGYGVAHCRIDGQLIRSAHRAAYILAVGPIPEGLHIDHLCRVRHCVNPAHLEAVTPAENNRRIPRERVGRPSKPPGERYTTPVRTFRCCDELWERLKAAATYRGETMTNVLERAALAYVEDVEREQAKP